MWLGRRGRLQSNYEELICEVHTLGDDNLWGQFVGYVDPTCGTINKNTMVLVNLKALQVKSQPK